MTRAAGEKVMVLIPTCSFQAKTNYGTAKGRISERPKGLFSLSSHPRTVLASGHGRTGSPPTRSFSNVVLAFVFQQKMVSYPSSVLRSSLSVGNWDSRLCAGTLVLPTLWEDGTLDWGFFSKILLFNQKLFILVRVLIVTWSIKVIFGSFRSVCEWGQSECMSSPAGQDLL